MVGRLSAVAWILNLLDKWVLWLGQASLQTCDRGSYLEELTPSLQMGEGWVIYIKSKSCIGFPVEGTAIRVQAPGSREDK